MTINKIMMNIIYLLAFSISILAYQALGTTTPKPVYQEVRVRSGDTLWTLAANYAESSSTDIREVIYHIRQVNQIANAGDLTPGMILRIPVTPDTNHKTDSVYIARQQ